MKFSIASILLVGSVVASAIPLAAPRADGALVQRNAAPIGNPVALPIRKRGRKTCLRKPKVTTVPGGTPGKPSYIVSGSKTVSTIQPTTTPKASLSESHSLVPSTTASLTSTIATPAVSPSATGPETVITKTTSSGASTATPTPTQSGVPAVIPVGSWISECTVPGDIALTFDDGPGEKTSKLVGLLNDAGFKATFFVNGNNWVGDISDNAEFTAILNNMIASGHQIGSHTFAHENLDESSAAEIKATLGKVDTWLSKAIGKKPTYMRPPYFACEEALCQSTVKDLGLHMFNANLDTKDYENNTEELINNAINTFDKAVLAGNPAKDSFVVLMHDVHATTVDILVPAIIETIKKSGFRAVTLGECLGDAPANWYKA